MAENDGSHEESGGNQVKEAGSLYVQEVPGGQ